MKYLLCFSIAPSTGAKRDIGRKDMAEDLTEDMVWILFLMSGHYIVIIIIFRILTSDERQA